jgi:serine/threonine protein kinase
MGDSEAGNSRPNLLGSAPPALTPERWQKIKEIFGSALERKPSERSAFVNDACGHDKSLRAEVESLLAEAEGRGAATAWVFKTASPSAASPNPRDETAGLGASQREVARDLVQDVSQAAAELDGNGPSNAILTKGSRLGDYEIVAQLESGGMSEVYRARDLRLHRDVAIKVLPPSFSADPERLRRFQHEARMAASLNHPHIVTIYAIEEAASIHFLAMELVDGETLEQVIPDNGLSLEKFFDLAIPLTEALAAAHDKGIIHRDIKPRNIMIDKRGNVKVLDFGLAKMTEFAGQTYQDAQTHSLTAVGVVMGTIPYMSPEQVQGQKLDARSDIFSLGAVLYQMATGRRPFHAESSAELISSILRDTPPTITELRSDVPAGMRRIIERCLAKQVDERYPSARDLREAFGSLAHGSFFRTSYFRSGRCAGRLHRSSPFHEHEHRPGKRFLCQRNHGRNHQCPGADRKVTRGGTNLCLFFQGQACGPAHHRGTAECPQRTHRQRSQIGESFTHQRPVIEGGGRLPTLVGALRPGNERCI